MKPITVSDRIGALEESAAAFKDHIIDVPGVALPAMVRLAVAQCARDAIHCKACMDNLPRDACLRPGTRLYEKVATTEHSVSGLQGVDNKKAETAIMAIIHSIVNHQGRLDKVWYDDCIQALSDAKIIPESATGGDKQQEKYRYLVYSAFAEIICIASMSYCINMAFLTMGRPVPRLPTPEEIKNGKAQETGPLLLDWTSILKKPPSRDLSTAFAYYFNASTDINQKCPDYLRISERGRQSMKKYGDPVHPCLCSAFAAEDVGMLDRLESVYYMPEKDMMLLFKSRLDPALRCADDFS